MPACALRAVWLDLRRGWVVARPAKHGLPHDRRGYAMVARRAMKMIGVKPENPVMRAGATYDAQKYRNAVRNVMADLKPVSCAVMPQAVGTPLSCGKKSGTVINIGHGTTGIVNAHGRSVGGISIPGAPAFIPPQMPPGEQQVCLCEPWGPLCKECGSHRKACAPGDPHSQLSCPDWRPGRGGSCRWWITRSWHGRRALKGSWLQCNTCRRSGNEQRRVV